MAKMIIMQGLPASGKSTRAKEIIAAEGNAVRINKDLLRTMLHFDKFTGPNEGKTRQAARELARVFLTNNINVIIDDTNLNPSTLQSWVDLAKELEAKIQHEVMDTSLQNCIERDAMREKSVGRDVITNMALSAGLYMKPEKGFVLCDLDGTLADITHRLQYAKGETKDWDKFFAGIPDDVPRMSVIDMVMDLEGQGFPIVFMSARPETHREATEAWLEKTFNGYRPHVTLIMRPANDKRPDTEVKAAMLDKHFTGYPIQMVIDDRPSVIRMWRKKGLNVVDVGAGIEF